jgi:hypothetical protein
VQDLGVGSVVEVRDHMAGLVGDDGVHAAVGGSSYHWAGAAGGGRTRARSWREGRGVGRGVGRGWEEGGEEEGSV